MDELIELHNEYRTTVFGKKIREWEENDLGPIEILISKNYGFIRWLVDNDKIYTRAQVIKDVETWGCEIKDVVCYDGYESLLMLLSIQEKPIEFLVSILKKGK